MFSGAIGTVRTGFLNYVEALPQNWELAAVKGFAAGFLVGTVFSGSPVGGMMVGALSTVATLVHAAVTPLFKLLNENNRPLECSQEILRGCFSFVVTGCIAASFGDPILVSSVGLFALIHGIRAIFDDSLRSTTRASWLVV